MQQDNCIEDFFIRQPDTPNPEAIAIIIKSNENLDDTFNEKTILSIHGGYFDKQFPKYLTVDRLIKLEKDRYLIVSFHLFNLNNITNSHSTFLDSLTNCTYENGLVIDLAFESKQHKDKQTYCPCYKSSKVVSVIAYTHE